MLKHYYNKGGGVGIPLSINHSKSAPDTDRVVIATLANLDYDTFLHSKRVQTLALKLGTKLDLTYGELCHLSRGALLHDIGKQFIPPGILRKKAPLTDEEWNLIKMHPLLGLRRVALTDLSTTVKGIILGHHLWANGAGGYPEMLENPKPCLLTQVITVADAVDAMMSNRPYRPALDFSTCLSALEKESGTKFNHKVVRALQRLPYRQLANLLNKR